MSHPDTTRVELTMVGSSGRAAGKPVYLDMPVIPRAGELIVIPTANITGIVEFVRWALDPQASEELGEPVLYASVGVRNPSQPSLEIPEGM